MSGETHPPTSAEPKPIATIAVISILFLIIFVAASYYVFTKNTEPQTPDQIRIAEREKILQDVRAETSKNLHETAWVDKEKGVVRIPIDRAMELTVQELKAKPVKAGEVANPVPSLVVPPPPQVK